MRVVKRFNNNVVLCQDDDGKQVVALGLGLGFISVGEEVDLARIQRTFYDANPEGWAFLDELNQEILAFSAQVTDIVRDWLPYQLSPNFAFILADHLAFAIKRMKENIRVRMPLSYDVEQQFPDEFRIGRFVCNRLAKAYNVPLPSSEIAGIALCFANNAFVPGSEGDHSDDKAVIPFEDVLEHSVLIVEKIESVSIDRSSFNFSRFATHLQYLYNRTLEGTPLEGDNASLYRVMCQERPDIEECVEKIAALFLDELGSALSEEERLYLMLHVNRMCSQGCVEDETGE